MLLSGTADARRVAGVELPEVVSLGGDALLLNGAGVREKYFIDIYVTALYLPTRTQASTVAIEEDVPKRLVMHFVYRRVSKQQAVDSLRWRIEKSPEGAVIAPQIEEFVTWLEDFERGDECVFDYVPGKGTTITVKGQVKGTIPGATFMNAVWGIFLGEEPVNESLKRGLLGG